MASEMWRDKLEFALKAPIEELVIDSIKVVGTLQGELGKITSSDLEALATWGLPTTDTTNLRPMIEPTISSHYLIGSSYEIGTLDSGRLFVRPEHGRVLTVNQEHGVSYSFVNSSIRQLVELAWRYHHASPVRVYLVEDWETVGVEADLEANDKIWNRANEIDPLIDIDASVSFWNARIRGLA